MKREENKPNSKFDIPFHNTENQVQSKPTKHSNSQKVKVRAWQTYKHFIQKGMCWITICILKNHVHNSE